MKATILLHLQKHHLIFVGCLFRSAEFLVPFNKTGIFDTWPGSFRRHITCCWVYVVVLILSVSNPPCLTKQCEHVCVTVRNESSPDDAPLIAKCLCKAGFKPNATDTSHCIRKCSNIKCIVCLPHIINIFWRKKLLRFFGTAFCNLVVKYLGTFKI